MANKCLKNISLDIQIKMTMKWYLPPNRMVIIKYCKYWQGWGEKNNSLCLFCFVQCWELTLCIVGQCSTTKLYHQSLKLIYDANEHTDYGDVP